MSEWISILGKAGPDTLIAAFVVFLVFSYAAELGPARSLMLGGGFLFLYVVMRYLLVWVRIREARELLKIDTQKESMNLFTAHASPVERDALVELERQDNERRSR